MDEGLLLQGAISLVLGVSVLMQTRAFVIRRVREGSVSVLAGAMVVGASLGVTPLMMMMLGLLGIGELIPVWLVLASLALLCRVWFHRRWCCLVSR